MKYIYTHIRADGADGEEIDMGPFSTKEEAETAMIEHSQFGDLCSGPKEVPDSYKLFKGEDK